MTKIIIFRCNHPKGHGYYGHTHCQLLRRSFACNSHLVQVAVFVVRAWRLSATCTLHEYNNGDFSWYIYAAVSIINFGRVSVNRFQWYIISEHVL